MPRPAIALTFCALFATPLAAQTARLVADINPHGPGATSSRPTEHATKRSGDLFAAFHPSRGVELVHVSSSAAWVDIEKGAASSSPRELTPWQGEVYFSAATAAAGRELWRFVDSVAPGARLAANIGNGAFSGNPQALTPVGSRALAFIADDGRGQNGLWAFDGNASRFVAQVSVIGFREGVVLSNGRIVFRQFTNGAGNEPWVSDLTKDGTKLLKDIRPGRSSGLTAGFGLAPGGSAALFAGIDTAGIELWATSGTAAGTGRIADIVAGAGSSSPKNFVLHPRRGETFFTVTNAQRRAELWSVDANLVARRRAAISPDLILPIVEQLTPTKNHLYFVASARVMVGTRRRVLKVLHHWDGTTLQIVRNGTGSGAVFLQDPKTVTWESRDDVVCNAQWTDTTRRIGAELFRAFPADAKGERFELLRDIRTGTGSSAPVVLGARHDESRPETYFSYDDGLRGRELGIRRNGRLDLLDLAPGGATTTLSSEPMHLVGLGTRLWLTATNGIDGRSLWKIEGGRASQVIDSERNLLDVPFRLLWRDTVNDNIAVVARQKPASSVNDTVCRIRASGLSCFLSVSFRSTVLGLYDRAFERIALVRNGLRNRMQLHRESRNPFLPLHQSGFIGRVTVVGSRLFFVSDKTNGRELWSYAGPDPALVADVFPGPASSDPDDLIEFGGKLLFAALSPATGREIWESDGTRNGTKVFLDVAPGAASSDARELTKVGARLFFAARVAGRTGSHIWTFDGSRLQQILIHSDATRDPFPKELTAVGETLFFVATDPAKGRELYKIDAKTLALENVTDKIHAGALSSNPGGLTPIGSRGLAFVMEDPAIGVEPWLAETSGRVRSLGDVDPGRTSSFPSDFVPLADGHLYFTAKTRKHGREVWSVDLDITTTILIGRGCGGPGRNPVFATVSDPAIGLTAKYEAVGAKNGAFYIAMLGADLANPINLPGTCHNLRMLALATLPAVRANESTWSTSLPIPNSPRIIGVQMAVQAFGVPTDGPGGIDTTNVARSSVGR